MLLKHLSLHGYKTFANQTGFLFHRGVTAVVGPNGSGKSNVADAIRWVLGEQAYSDLRAKKTEDLIFSGSAVRAKSGMAEVQLTLENLRALASEIELQSQPEPAGAKPRAKPDPVAELLHANPSEVTISRRAYRDGENEYFLNGKRVRLRDVVELLERWGLARNTYAVVGQGLMDQALSLRPEERRTMFEEAAGIGTYETKRKNALEKLEETHQNLLRVNDIIAEIGPRLPALARQAERAKNYEGVVRALDEKLRTHYAFHWARAQAVLGEAAAREETARHLLNGKRRELTELGEKLAQLRRQGQALRMRLGEGRRSRTALESEHATRSRELAVLEERIRFTTQQRDDAAEDLRRAQDDARGVSARVSTAQAAVVEKEHAREATQTRLREADQNLSEHKSFAAQFQQVESWLERVRAFIRRVARLKDELDAARGLQLARELSEEATHLAQYEDQQLQAADAVESSRAQAAELRTALALAERDVTSARAELQSARGSSAQMERETARRNERVAALTRQVEALTTQKNDLNARVAVSSRALAQIDESVVPAASELAAGEQTQIELEQQETQLRARLGEFEETHNTAVLEVERHRAASTRLETEIEDDLVSGRLLAPTVLFDRDQNLEGENMRRILAGNLLLPNGAEEKGEEGEVAREATIETDPARPEQLRLRSGDDLIELPVVAAVHEGLEKEIRRLRNQLKYMGAVNPSAPQEYDELKARHAFLTEQATDAQQTIETLRQALAELDEIMRRKFEETFKAVNAEFASYFTLLFNGGTARLELTQPDDILQTGVDIIARPPGKRATHLAMLSGGERALTAAALLFAILKVSPTPFCVMDEVDAMLDESNVGRFNDALKSLGAATQFIIITHNRRTIENSDTVYGITMGEDGVSQAISLRLNGTERAKSTAAAMTIVARKTREKRKF